MCSVLYVCLSLSLSKESKHTLEILCPVECCAGWVQVLCSALRMGACNAVQDWAQCSAGWVHTLLCGMGAVFCGMGACVAVRDQDGCMRCCAGWVQCSAGWVAVGWVHALLCRMGAVLCGMGACVAVRDGYIQCGQRLSVARVKRDITQHVCTLFGYQPFLCICICISVFAREKIRKPTRLPLQYTMLYSADYYCTEEYRGL